jgi:hypothetical protein
MFRHLLGNDRKLPSLRRGALTPSTAVRLRKRLALEHLEDRTVPSTITWTNRGQLRRGLWHQRRHGACGRGYGH